MIIKTAWISGWMDGETERMPLEWQERILSRNCNAFVAVFFSHIVLILKHADLSSVVLFLTGLHYGSDRKKQKEMHSVDFWHVKQNQISSPPSVLSFYSTACSQQPRLWAGALTQTDLSRSERVIPHARGSPVIRILIWQERQKVELRTNAIVKTNAWLSKKKGKRNRLRWDGKVFWPENTQINSWRESPDDSGWVKVKSHQMYSVYENKKYQKMTC